MYFRYIVLIAVYQCLAVHAEYGLMKIESTVSTESVEICAASNSNNHKFSSSGFNESSRLSHKYGITFPYYGCSPIMLDDFIVNNTVVIVNKGNCKFIDKAINVQNANGTGILIVSEDLFPTVTYTKIKTNISIAVITEKSFKLYNEMRDKDWPKIPRISEYKPVKTSFMDPNVMAMWLFAVFTVALGGWCNRKSKERSKTCKRIISKKRNQTKMSAPTAENEEGTRFAVCFILGFVCEGIVIVISITYFQGTIYVFMFVQYFCATGFLYIMIKSYVESLTFNTNFRALQNKPNLKRVLSWWRCIWFIFCVTFFVVCVVYRNAWFAWIMQDVLAFAFSFCLIQDANFANLKVSIIILVGSVFIEIGSLKILFFFNELEISQSTLDSAGELEQILDILLIYKLPRFVITPIGNCAQLRYSMLSYLNIWIPGWHIGSCATWDYNISQKTGVKTHLYYLSALVGYGIGLGICIANAVLAILEPVRLYVVPCCLLSTVLVAVLRNELGDIWKGNANKPVSRTQIKKVVTTKVSDIRLV